MVSKLRLMVNHGQLPFLNKNPKSWEQIKVNCTRAMQIIEREKRTKIGRAW